jgi:hypothetical protein
MALHLSGCWAARQIARITITSRLHMRVDAHSGAITVERLHDPVWPLTITVRFKTRLRSAPTGARLVLRRDGVRNASVTVPVGGPACRDPQHVTRRPRPTATATSTPKPTSTTTPAPTATFTPMPVTTPVRSTSTPTNTLVPPPSTPTATPVPPTATTTSVPTATPTSSGSSDPVVMAAGDIACDRGDPAYNSGNGTGTACMQLATSNELSTAVAVLPLGDDQYNSGTLSAFDTVYDPTWGRYKANTYPASGNHEYETSGAAGYYSYFGRAASPQDTHCTANCKGYYSYNLGAWHLIALNSECAQVGGCNAGSPQERWLKADLAAHSNLCTLAYWHRPLFTSGISLGDSDMHDVWEDLYNAHADLVLNGHDHIYERFAPQDPSGTADPTNGITEIIVGTGGADHESFVSTAANSVVRDNTTFGVLKLTLLPTSFAWQFLPETAGGNGTFTDSGSQACH